MFFDSIEAMLMIFIMIAIGFFISKTKWCNEKARNFVSRLVMTITLPCTIVVSFLSYFSPSMLAGSLIPLLAAYIAAVGVYFLSKLVCRLARIKRGRRGVFTMLCAVSNAAFVGFPVAQAIFGDEGFIYAVLFFMTQNTLINTVGFFEVSSDGDENTALNGTKKLTGRKDMLKRLFNPLFVTLLISILLIALGVTIDVLPKFISRTITYVGEITSPLSLIFVGMVIGSMGFKNLKIKKGHLLLMLIRFAAAPLIMLLVTYLFGIDTFCAQVFILLSALPSMVQVSVMAEMFGGDIKYAATGMLFTTIVSLGVIPLYMYIFSLF